LAGAGSCRGEDRDSKGRRRRRRRRRRRIKAVNWRRGSAAGRRGVWGRGMYGWLKKPAVNAVILAPSTALSGRTAERGNILDPYIMTMSPERTGGARGQQPAEARHEQPVKMCTHT
jgi:hypothetical protein